MHEKGNPKQTRRSFLKSVFWGAGFGLLLKLGIIDHSTWFVTEAARHGIGFETFFSIQIPRLLDEAKQEAAKDGITLTENKRYRSMRAILQSALATYEKSTGNRPYFVRSADFVPDEAFFSEVGNQLPPQFNLEELLNKLKSRDGTLSRSLYLSTGYNLLRRMSMINQVSYSFLLPESGITHRATMEIREKHPSGDADAILEFLLSNIVFESKVDFINAITFSPNGLPFDLSVLRDIDTALFIEFDDMRDWLIESSKYRNEHISVEEILLRCLEKNSGNIVQSLLDTGMHLKALARHRFGNMEEKSEVPNSLKFVGGDVDMHDQLMEQFPIVDEGNLLGGWTELVSHVPDYNHPNKNVSIINLIGTPYHLFNIVALLAFIGTNTVRAGVVSQLLVDEDHQGKVKIASDYACAQELEEIEQLLLSYEVDTAFNAKARNRVAGSSRRKFMQSMFIRN